MAEIFGTVAAVLQVIETIKKVTELIGEVQQGGELAQQINDSVRNLELALRQAQLFQAMFEPAQQAIVQCILDSIKSRLQFIRDELTAYANSRSKTIGNLKLVLHKKSSIMSAFADLEREKSSLMLINNSMVATMFANKFNHVDTALDRILIQSTMSHGMLSEIQTKLQVLDRGQIGYPLTLHADQMFRRRLVTGSSPMAQETLHDNQYSILPRYSGESPSALGWAAEESYDNQYGEYKLQDNDNYAFQCRFGSLRVNVSSYGHRHNQGGQSLLRITAALEVRANRKSLGRAVEFRFQEVIQNSRLFSPFASLSTARVIPASESIPPWTSLGDVNELRGLLSRRAISVHDRREGSGLGYLHIAASFGQLEILKILISEGADPEMRDNDSRTALDILHEYAPQALVVKEDEKLQNFGRSSTQLAQAFQDCCRFLESKGCSSEDSFDLLGLSMTSMMFATAAIGINRGEDFTQLQPWGRFISNMGVDIDAFYGADFNALIALCRDPSSPPDENRIAMLLAMGASVHTVCEDRMQPMHHLFSGYISHRKYGVWKSTLRTATLLIRAGADLNFQDKFGRTPRDYAVMNGILGVYRSAVRAARPSNMLEGTDAPCHWRTWSWLDETADLQDSDQEELESAVQTIARLNREEHEARAIDASKLSHARERFARPDERFGLTDIFRNRNLTIEMLARVLFHFALQLLVNTMYGLKTAILFVWYNFRFIS